MRRAVVRLGEELGLAPLLAPARPSPLIPAQATPYQRSLSPCCSPKPPSDRAAPRPRRSGPIPAPGPPPTDPPRLVAPAVAPRLIALEPGPIRTIAKNY